ncbi:hypothetical protein D1872_314190 [compost metagenome]
MQSYKIIQDNRNIKGALRPPCLGLPRYAEATSLAVNTLISPLFQLFVGPTSILTHVWNSNGSERTIINVFYYGCVKIGDASASC